jgi:hypothetical protein
MSIIQWLWFSGRMSQRYTAKSKSSPSLAGFGDYSYDHGIYQLDDILPRIALYAPIVAPTAIWACSPLTPEIVHLSVHGRLREDDMSPEAFGIALLYPFGHIRRPNRHRRKLMVLFGHRHTSFVSILLYEDNLT